MIRALHFSGQHQPFTPLSPPRWKQATRRYKHQWSDLCLPAEAEPIFSHKPLKGHERLQDVTGWLSYPINLDLFHSYWRAWINILYTLIPTQHVSLTSPTADKHDFHDLCMYQLHTFKLLLLQSVMLQKASIQHLLDILTSNMSFPLGHITKGPDQSKEL